MKRMATINEDEENGHQQGYCNKGEGDGGDDNEDEENGYHR